MTKTFRIKKITLLLLLFLSTIIFVGCANKYITMSDGVDITVSQSYYEHMLDKTNLPKIHFDYNGVNISNYSTNSQVIFVQNDQYALSDAFSKHLSMYRDDQKLVTKSDEQTNDYPKAKIGTDKLTIDEGTKSLEEIMIVTLDDGTRVSYSYRTFVSNGKRYYAYKYIENMMISLEMPFMVVERDGVNKLVLLALPYDTRYIVGGNIEVDSLIEKDTYVNTKVEEDYYVFNYPTYFTSKTLNKDELVSMTKEWYIMHCNGKEENNDFVFEYLGFKYKINFDCEKVSKVSTKLEPAFEIIFIG